MTGADGGTDPGVREVHAADRGECTGGSRCCRGRRQADSRRQHGNREKTLSDQPVGAVLLRSVFAEAEEVGEGRQVRRPGR